MISAITGIASISGVLDANAKKKTSAITPIGKRNRIGELSVFLDLSPNIFIGIF
jgi:hypothetical protein